MILLLRWRTISHSPDYWAWETPREPTCLYSKMPDLRDTNLSRESLNFWKLQHLQSHLFLPPSLPSTLLIVSMPLFSRMGWSNAFPSHRKIQILGLCWRNHISSRTNHLNHSSFTPITTIHSLPISDTELSVTFFHSWLLSSSLMLMLPTESKFSKSIFLTSIATYVPKSWLSKTNIFSIIQVFLKIYRRQKGCLVEWGFQGDLGKSSQTSKQQ